MSLKKTAANVLPVWLPVIEGWEGCAFGVCADADVVVEVEVVAECIF